MGRKKVIHVEARSAVRGLPYTATTRLEVIQQSLIAARKGDPIQSWNARTDKGRRILGVADSGRGCITAGTGRVPGINLQICPGCYGSGCAVCNESGMTTKAMIKRHGDFSISQVEGDLHGDLAKKRTQQRAGLE